METLPRYCLVVVYFIVMHFASIDLVAANPFSISFSPKETISNDEYLSIQEQLRAIDITPTLREIYPNEPGYTGFEDFLYRCTRGIQQTLIDPNGRFPRKHLEQIGKKSDVCFVTYSSFNRVYAEYVQRLPQELRKVGFNGFLLYYIGGFPNPTGWEIQYAGVPYCFKIFMMLEAQKLGFNKVIWIDASAVPLRNPAPLFEWLDKNETFLMEEKSDDLGRFLFPATRDLLKDLTGTDVLHARYIRTIVFGLKMDSPKVQKLIKTYYEFVELGTPFLSCFPEEFVLTSLFGQPEFNDWKAQPFKLLSGSDKYDTPQKMKKGKKDGFFFYHLKH